MPAAQLPMSRPVRTPVFRPSPKNRKSWHLTCASHASQHQCPHTPSLAKQSLLHSAAPQQHAGRPAVSVLRTAAEGLQAAARACTAVLTSVLLSLAMLMQPLDAAALPAYNEIAQRDEGDMFTADAWQGMQRLSDYFEYVQGLSDEESSPGCEQCAANRAVFERAWQTVANEFFDPTARFSQAWWAGQLQQQLQDCGGVLHTQQELDIALEHLMLQLNDKYSAYLRPSDFRRALRRPLPMERDYYQALFVGVGLQLGEVAGEGAGRVVEATLPGSPAEAAGLMRGDVVLHIDGIPVEGLSAADVAALMRGPAGSSVMITWQHKNGTQATSSTATPADPTLPADVLTASNSYPGGNFNSDRLLDGAGGSFQVAVPVVPETASISMASLERRRLPQPVLREARLPLTAALSGAQHTDTATVDGVGDVSPTASGDAQHAGTAGQGNHAHMERVAATVAGGSSVTVPALLGIPASRAAFSDEVAYLRIYHMGGDTSTQVAAALARGEQDGVAGYILDLRNNPGGVFEEAIATAALFLEPGTQVAATVRNQEVIDASFVVGELSPEIYDQLPPVLLRATAGSSSERGQLAARPATYGEVLGRAQGTVTQAPVVVLVNANSASASEVLAGALRDNHRALMIGVNTFGKGVVQWYFPLTGSRLLQEDRNGWLTPVSLPTPFGGPDSSGGLKITVAKYLTPSGWDITRQGGLKPDVVCGDYPHEWVLTGRQGGGAETSYGWQEVGGSVPGAMPGMDDCIQLALQQIQRLSSN